MWALIILSVLSTVIILNCQQGGISIGIYLYNVDNIALLLGIITILLIILLAVVLIVNLEIGPLLKRLYFDSLKKISHCGCEDVLFTQNINRIKLLENYRSNFIIY